MTLKELFSGWRNLSELLKGCIIACVLFMTLAVADLIGKFPLRPYIIFALGLYQLLCLILAYRIIKKSK